MIWEEIHKEIFATQEMIDLKAWIKQERQTKVILPAPADVMNAFKYTPYDSVRWVMIGQDPYPDSRYPHGLSFSSLTRDTPGSLRNIFKEIQRSLYPDYTVEQLFKHNNLTSWAKQGVLLLNTILTVEENKPGSHAGKGWEVFTRHIIASLDKHPTNLVFFLWGKTAQQLRPLIKETRHLVLETSHPSPLSVKAGFEECNHFAAAMSFIRNDYLDIRSAVDYLTIEKLLIDFSKKNNITFDMMVSRRLPMGLLIPDVVNKTQIDLHLE